MFGGPILNIDAILSVLDRQLIDEKTAQGILRASLSNEEVEQLNLPSNDAPLGESALTCWNVPPDVMRTVETALGTYYLDAVTGEIRGRKNL